MSNSATPWTVAHQAPLSMGFSRQEYWRGLPCPPAGDLPNPGIEPVSHVSCIGRQVLYHLRHLGSPSGHSQKQCAHSCSQNFSSIFFINKSPILLSCLEFQEHGAILESCGLRLLCAQTLEPVSSLSSASSSAIGLCAGYLSFSASASLSTN